MKLVAIALLLSLACVYSFDVVGWYVGTNLTDLELLNWDIYTTLRAGGLLLAANGTVTGCDPMDGAFAEMLRVTQKYNRTITLSADFGHCKWQDTNATTIEYCQTFLRTLGPAVRSCGPNIAGMEFGNNAELVLRHFKVAVRARVAVISHP